MTMMAETTTTVMPIATATLCSCLENLSDSGSIPSSLSMSEMMEEGEESVQQ